MPSHTYLLYYTHTVVYDDAFRCPILRLSAAYTSTNTLELVWVQVSVHTYKHTNIHAHVCECGNSLSCIRGVVYTGGGGGNCSSWPAYNNIGTTLAMALLCDGSTSTSVYAEMRSPPQTNAYCVKMMSG